MTAADTPDGLPPLRDVINQYGLRADKKFGQNFILDLNLTRRIAREAGDISACEVIEVGPGPGGLTRGLLMEGAKHVHVIEADPRFLPALQDIAAAYPGRLSIHQGDALKITPQSLTQAPYRIVSNLPYNIATPLLTGWLDSGWQERCMAAAIFVHDADVSKRSGATHHRRPRRQALWPTGRVGRLAERGAAGLRCR